ncbi:MAG: hypothetical protein JNK74_02425 [Candidatus Hydrogenedentes bacterium]|nr:hypothetical protein [Candidatus Hydrogenedentota bacterium]
MAHVAAARQGIRSYRMHIKWHTRRFASTSLNNPLPTGVTVSEGEGIWIEQGEKWRVHHSRCNQRTDLLFSPGLPLDTPPRSDFPQVEYQFWAAFNGDEYAMRSTEYATDFLTYCPGEVVRSGEHVQVGAALYPFPLKWGFGFGSEYLTSFTKNPCPK